MVELILGNRSQGLIYLMILICVILGVMSSGIFMIAGVLIFAISIVVKKWDDFPGIFLLFSFANILKTAPGTSSMFTILCLLYVIVSLIGTRRIRNSVLVGIFVLASYIVITDFNGIESAIKLVIAVLLIYCYSEKSDIQLMKYSTLCYCDGLILSLLLSQNSSFYNHVLPYMRVVYWKTGTNIFRSCGLFTDPNYCGMAVIMGISALIVLYNYHEIKIGFWIRTVLLAALGLLTYSKSYILMLVFVVVYAMLFVFLKRRSPVFILAGIGIWIVTYYALNGRIEAINRVMYRFETLDFTTGRTEKNLYYLNYLWDNFKVLFFGTGISIDRLPDYNNVHNFPIESIQRIGLVGTFLYVAVIKYASNIPIIAKRDFIAFFPIIIMSVMYLSLAGLTGYEFPFYVSFCIMGLKIGNPQHE